MLRKLWWFPFVERCLLPLDIPPVNADDDGLKGKVSSMRKFQLLVVSFLALMAFGCQKANVQVYCSGTQEGFNCELEHVDGNAKAEACWEIVVECENKEEVRHAACHSVEPGKKSSLLIPYGEVKDADKCDKATKLKVADLKVKLAK